MSRRQCVRKIFQLNYYWFRVVRRMMMNQLTQNRLILGSLILKWEMIFFLNQAQKIIKSAPNTNRNKKISFYIDPLLGHNTSLALIVRHCFLYISLCFDKRDCRTRKYELVVLFKKIILKRFLFHFLNQPNWVSHSLPPTY